MRKFLKTSDEEVCHCINFIYGLRFRKLMAVGCRKLYLQDGTSVVIPKVGSKMSK